MQPIELAIRDAYRHGLELFERKQHKSSPALLQTVRFAHPEKIPGEPDPTCIILYSLQGEHTREAEAKRVSGDSYRIYEVHTLGGILGTVRERPFTLSGHAYPAKTLMDKKHAAEALLIWEKEQDHMLIPRQTISRSVDRSPYHPSHWPEAPQI